MTGRIDQVDQEVVLFDLDGQIFKILLILELTVQGDGGRLDGDTTFLLVWTSICESGFTGLRGRDDTGALDKRIGEGGLSVIDCVYLSASSCVNRLLAQHTVRNNRHVSDIGRLVHELTDLSILSVFFSLC